LHESVSRGDHDGLRRRLATTDTKLDEKNAEGNTPLHIAVFNGTHSLSDNAHYLISCRHYLCVWLRTIGDVESAQLLINAGASPDVVNVLQRTPLHLAALRGLSALLTILIEAGTPLTIHGHYLVWAMVIAMLIWIGIGMV
jgi:ankyrin repeat protein